MANYPKKLMDPTEAALSAIQEALNVRDDEERHPAQPDDSEISLAHSADAMPQTEPARPAFDEAIDLDDIDTRGARIAEPQPFHAANDDQQSIGRILRALQDRPAKTSYLVAAMFSAAWVVGCLALSWAYLADFNAALGLCHSPAAAMIGLGAAALLPIIFFFGIAHMAWRSQELRLITQSMAQVAMRLAEPESVARDSIVTVGQAIRREVAAMGDGVERALARAGELETLVQNEVAALERTYSDNEVRIRGLLQELASQRDTLVGQAEQVRSAINNVQIDLTQDLSTISELVGQQVNEAAMRITHSLAERGENITMQLSQIGDNMVQQLGERGGDLLDRLEAASEETSRAIAAASDRLTANLNFKTNHIGDEFAEIATGLEDMMTQRLAVVDLMIGRSQELTDAIIDTSSQLAETIATRADEVNSTLKASGESLILDLNLRGGDVAKKLEHTGARITETLISRSTGVTDSLRESVEQFVGTVATRGDAIKDMLSTRLGAFEETVSTRSDAMRDMLATRLAAFEEVFDHSGAELG